MKRQTRTLALLSLGSMIMIGAAQAQPPAGTQGGPPQGSSSSGSSSSGSSSSGSSPSGPPPGTTMQQTTTTTTQTGDALATDAGVAQDESAVPATGGEPWMMVFAGSLIAVSAFAMRRRLS